MLLDATRPSLLLRIRDANDAEAWHDFVQLYGGLINDYSLRRGLQPADAAEVTQDVLLQVSKSIGSFAYEPMRGKFRSWLAVITRTKHIELLKRDRRYRNTGSEIEFEELAGEVDALWQDAWHAHVAQLAMRHVQGRMSPEAFAAFRAAWIDDLPVSEIATRFAKDAAWVYVSKCRGLKLLREAILELSDGPEDL